MSDEMIRPRRGRPPAAESNILASLPPQEAAPSREEMHTSREGAGRRKRIPLGGKQLRLSATTRKGYVPRWINDNDGRLEQARAAGYEFVLDDTVANSTDTGTRKSQVVGTRKDGSPMRAYLMEIPADWHAEDQAAKQAEVDKVDEAIRAGGINGTVGVDGRYIPSQGISVKTGKSARPAPSSNSPDNGD